METKLRVYNEYKKHGVDNYYKKYSDSYINPHENKIDILYKKYLLKGINNKIRENKSILDIACGEGLIKKIVENNYTGNNKDIIIKGTDPYFKNKYCNYSYSFEDIAKGKLKDKFNIGVCCYAFHLLNNSWYYSFLSSLSEIIEDKFIIITPSKKIKIQHYLWKEVLNIRFDKITLIIIKKLNKK